MKTYYIQSVPQKCIHFSTVGNSVTNIIESRDWFNFYYYLMKFSWLMFFPNPFTSLWSREPEMRVNSFFAMLKIISNQRMLENDKETMQKRKKKDHGYCTKNFLMNQRFIKLWNRNLFTTLLNLDILPNWSEISEAMRKRGQNCLENNWRILVITKLFMFFILIYYGLYSLSIIFFAIFAFFHYHFRTFLDYW